jgi:hypothetical protein
MIMVHEVIRPPGRSLSRPLTCDPVNEQVEQIPSASDQDGVQEAWTRLTGEPSIRNVEAWLHLSGGWVVTIWAQEFYRQDHLGEELRARLARALESVDRVTSVAEHDNESWRVSGTPSGEALTRAAANVVDDMADRLRAGSWIASGPVNRPAAVPVAGFHDRGAWRANRELSRGISEEASVRPLVVLGSVLPRFFNCAL